MRGSLHSIQSIDALLFRPAQEVELMIAGEVQQSPVDGAPADHASGVLDGHRVVHARAFAGIAV